MSLAAKQCMSCKGASPLSPADINAHLARVSGWSLSADGKWIAKKFTFKNFADALSFVNKAGAVADAQNHHPDIELGWGYANFKFQTHDVGGLHENDFIMAAKLDALL